jgi:hypothetical protein
MGMQIVKTACIFQTAHTDFKDRNRLRLIAFSNEASPSAAVENGALTSGAAEVDASIAARAAKHI